MNPEICIIAAMSENMVIGENGKIPWYIPEDMRRFRQLTTPHPIIMGRKTFASIGNPLPKRLNILVSRNLTYEMNSYNLVVENTLEDAINFAIKADDERIFIIGGGEIYRQSMDRADRLFLTLVERNFHGDTFFPNYNDFKTLVSQEPGEFDGLKYKFLELTK